MTAAKSWRWRRRTPEEHGAPTPVADGIVIALDAMGGDHAPESVVRGAHIALKRFPHVHFQLFGDEARIRPLLAKYKKLARRVTIHHTDEAVSGEAKPSQALRSGRRSSMRLAIDAV